MAMARSAAALISENLKYPDGTPVQCVIGCTTIGGGAEAARVADQFSTENVVGHLVRHPVLVLWHRGPSTWTPRPSRRVWGFNGTERPGAVYLAAVMAAHAQRGLPAFSIYGHDVQDITDTSVPADVAEKLLRFARCAIAVGWMKNKAYVNLGGVAMGIAGSYCDAGVMQHTFGLRPEWVDPYRDPPPGDPPHLRPGGVREGPGLGSRQTAKRALTATPARTCRRSSPSRRWLPPDQGLGVRGQNDHHHAGHPLRATPSWTQLGWHEEALGRNGVVGGFQGQRQWTDWLPNADFTEAILASTFDWNGVKQPTPFATENDTCNGISMLLGTLISGTAPCFHDVRTYWSPEACERVTGWKPEGPGQGRLYPPHQLRGHGPGRLRRRLQRRRGALPEALLGDDPGGTWTPAWPLPTGAGPTTEYFRGGGFSSPLPLPGGDACHHAAVQHRGGRGPHAADRRGLDRRPAGQRPQPHGPPHRPHLAYHLVRAPGSPGEGAFASVYDVMANWGANHGVTVVRAMWGADLITLASMLRIPVAMHNVPQEKVYRPHAWAAFGTQDTQAADYAACKHYGPLFRLITPPQTPVKREEGTAVKKPHRPVFGPAAGVLCDCLRQRRLRFRRPRPWCQLPQPGQPARQLPNRGGGNHHHRHVCALGPGRRTRTGTCSFDQDTGEAFTLGGAGGRRGV